MVNLEVNTSILGGITLDKRALVRREREIIHDVMKEKFSTSDWETFQYELANDRVASSEVNHWDMLQAMISEGYFERQDLEEIMKEIQSGETYYQYVGSMITDMLKKAYLNMIREWIMTA